MRTSPRIFNNPINITGLWGAILFLGLALILPGPARAGERFNILSLNLDYVDGIHRSERLTRLADWLSRVEGAEDQVDVILLQEVVGGTMAGTDNSAQDLQGLLAQRGLFFHLAFVQVNDIWGIIFTGTAILSRYPFIHEAWVDLPSSDEHPSPGIEIGLDWKALYVELDLPIWGPTPLFNVHLCANCHPQARQTQVQTLLEAVQGVITDRGLADSPMILAGDFNFHLANPPERSAYEELRAAGFEDAWAQLKGCYECCVEDGGNGGCTYGRPGNPWAVDIYSRTDYVFFRQTEAETAAVIFTGSDGWVSDHSALLVGLKLPWE
jgi:endonuclease/exonuclease/phosphatase family metal-dependent hydrolase